MKKIFTLTILITLLITSVTVAQEEQRGFIFTGGIGFADMQWSDEDQQLMDTLEDDPTVDRYKVHINLGIGGAINQKTYLLATLNGYGDRLEDSYGDHLQLNMYLYGAGVRWYPFTTGLVLGTDLGFSRGVADASFADSYVTDWGTGFGFTAGYDFDSTTTGFTGIIGVKMLSLAIESDNLFGASIFLNFAFK